MLYGNCRPSQKMPSRKHFNSGGNRHCVLPAEVIILKGTHLKSGKISIILIIAPFRSFIEHPSYSVLRSAGLPNRPAALNLFMAVSHLSGLRTVVDLTVKRKRQSPDDAVHPQK